MIVISEKRDMVLKTQVFLSCVLTEFDRSPFFSDLTLNQLQFIAIADILFC